MTETEGRGLEQEVAALRRVVEITALLSSTLNLDELLGRIMSSAAELLEADTSSLLLADEDSGELRIAVAVGETGAEVLDQRVPAGQGIAGWVMERSEPVVVNDPKADERFYSGVDEATGFETRNIIAVPLRARDRTIGVVEVINKRAGGFDEHDQRLALALASQAAIAIENARLYARLADAVVASRMSYRL
jgi:sigma-B regulation protein RsbU (phosphoserine phosphatase)